MGYNVSALTNYVNEQSTELIGRLYFEKKSADYFTTQSGVKKTDALQLLAVNAIPQDGATCGADASGSVTFSQRNLTVSPIVYHDQFCNKDLLAKWTQIQLRAGSNEEDEEMVFQQEITNLILSQIMEIDEVQDWQGDTASGDAYLNKYDGLIKIIDAAGTAITGNTASASTITNANAYAIVNAMCDARPAKLKSKTNQVLFCGTDTFDKYINNLNNDNLFNVDATAWADYTIGVVGKNVTLVGVHGLDGTDRLFLSRSENLFLGFDLQNDEEQFKIWYSEDDDVMKYRVKYKRGLQVAYPDEIVEFTLAV